MQKLQWSSTLSSGEPRLCPDLYSAFIECLLIIKLTGKISESEHKLLMGNAAISIEDLPNVKAWMARVEERPAVQQGIDTPEPFDREAHKDPKKLQGKLRWCEKAHSNSWV